MPPVAAGAVRTELLSDPWVIAVLLLDLVVLAVIVVLPLRKRYDDDLGDGRAVVLVPPPHPLSGWRTARAVAAFLLVATLQRALWGSWSPDGRYQDLVVGIAQRAVAAPAQLEAVSWATTLGLRGIIVAVIVSFVVGVHASPLRRLLMLVHVPIYLAIIVVIDALTLIGSALYPPLAPVNALTGQFITLCVGLLVLLRLVFSSFALPAATSLPRAPVTYRRARSDSALLLIVTVVGVVISGCICVSVIAAVPYSTRATVAILLPLPFAGISTLIRTMLLHLMRWFRRPDPPHLDPPVPVDVIIPAYNEEEQIADTLHAIDRAAAVYGGPVRVILANDASTDRTEAIARDVIDRFTTATGTVLTARRGGKSASLNAALAEAKADIVIRIDADTNVDRLSIRNAARWFARPEIGLVEAMVVPKPGGSWFRRMRVFETLRIHGFMHPAYQMVDGVNVVPGMFVAFRRQAVLDIGGFTAGMNGEDADLTLQLGRLGYRSWLDPEVVMYEDVPQTWADFREQRSRWSRATVMAFARHSPFRLGFGSPMVWFTQTRLMLFRLVAVARVAAWAYVPLVVLFAGPSRYVVVSFVFGWLCFVALLAVIDLALALRFGLLGRMGWFIGIVPFIVLRQLFSLEGLLSFPTRPVRLPGRVLPARSMEPVIH